MTNEQWESEYRRLRDAMHQAIRQVSEAEVWCKDDKTFDSLVKIDKTLSDALYGRPDTDA